jgi:hypothetical protein
MRRFKIALPAVAMIAILAAAPLALGQEGPPPPPDGWYLNITIDSTAKLMNQGIILHLSGTYTCADPVDGSGNDSYGFPFDSSQSGFNGGVQEIVKNDVVSGGFGKDGSSLTCDGVAYTWDAYLNGQGSNGPALWKAGKAIAGANGRICDTSNNCANGGTQRVIQIRH